MSTSINTSRVCKVCAGPYVSTANTGPLAPVRCPECWNKGWCKPEDKVVQETFDLLITEGYYNKLHQPIVGGGYSSSYMCNALDLTHQMNLISTDSYKLCKAAIKSYIGYSGSLIGALWRCKVVNCNDMDIQFPVCLAIYQDWANRPVLNFPQSVERL